MTDKHHIPSVLIDRHIGTLIAVISIAILCIALYYPYLTNELVFDDLNLFKGPRSIFDFAINPFDSSPRTFPLFTLGFVESTWHDITVHRWVSLSIHISNALLIYRLLLDLLRLCAPQRPIQSHRLSAATGAVFFALHPVAVYGAGYLAQRTILLATFFSLWAIYFYLRSYRRNAIADLCTAALCYTLAIFSKEHAIMLPAAIALASFLQRTDRKEKLIKALLFLVLCAPSGIYVILRVRGVIGAYEPIGEASTSGLPPINLKDSHSGQWALSAFTQAGQIFHYIGLWLVPNPQWMSFDIRVDFANQLQTSKIFLNLLAYAGFVISACALLRRSGLPAMAGLGAMYVIFLYCTEFVGFRLQEPFVLYRSYLWAPGILIILTAALSSLNLSPRTSLLLPIALTICLFPLSRDRLDSLRNEFSAWQDAEQKLVSESIPGADRIYFNLGNQLIQKKRFAEGITLLGKVILLDPDIPHGYLGRGTAYARQGEYQFALNDFMKAIALAKNTPLASTAEYNAATMLRALGQHQASREMYETSAKHGHHMASIMLELTNR